MLTRAEFSSNHLLQETNIVYKTSRKPDTLIWPPWSTTCMYLHAHAWLSMHVCPSPPTNPHTHIFNREEKWHLKKESQLCKEGQEHVENSSVCSRIYIKKIQLSAKPHSWNNHMLIAYQLETVKGMSMNSLNCCYFLFSLRF